MKRFLLFGLMAAVASVSALAQTVRPAEPTDLKAQFILDGANSRVEGSGKAPTMTQSYSDPQPLTENLRIEVTRGCYAVGEYDEPVATISDVAPGAVFSFTDSEELVFGNSYTYSVRAYIGEESSYSAQAYVYVGVKPAAVEIISVESDENGNSPVTVVFKAPSTDDSGKPLPVPLTSIEVKQYVSYGNEQLLYTVENPTGGETYTFVHDAENGTSVTYHIYANTEFGTSDYATQSIYVGPDVPARPENVTAEAGEGGVTISWTAPKNGKNFGKFDPADTRYRVVRYGGSEPKEVATGLDALSFVDECADIERPTSVFYRVTAFNQTGTGDYADTEPMVVGPAVKFPFVENFNGGDSQWSKEAENIWSFEWDEDSYSSDWTVATDDNMLDYTLYLEGGVDGEGDGFAKAWHKWSYGSDHDWMVSPAICAEGSKYPVLTYYYVPLPGRDNHLAVEFRKQDGSVVTADELDLSEGSDAGATEPEWKRRVVPVEAIAGEKEIKLAFHASTPADGTFDNFNIDAVTLDDYPYVETIEAEPESETSTLISWEAPFNSSMTADAYDVRINGGEPVRVTVPEYSLASEKGKDYSVTVQALYGDVPSRVSAPLEFVGGVATGIESVEASEIVKVEYLDLNGLRVQEPQKDMILVKRVTTADGRVRNELKKF